LGDPILGATISPLALWLVQTTDTGGGPSGTIIDQLPNYGLAGLIVGLVIWGLNYFNKREDKNEAVHKSELDSIRGDMEILRQELANERLERRRQEIQYLDQISKLQTEITELRVRLAIAQKRMDGQSN
jgi:hypothetical protein